MSVGGCAGAHEGGLDGTALDARPDGSLVDASLLDASRLDASLLDASLLDASVRDAPAFFDGSSTDGGAADVTAADSPMRPDAPDGASVERDGSSSDASGPDTLLEAGACASGVQCGGACVDVLSDPSHCGACGNGCPATAHGVPTCRAGTCDVACDSGYVGVGASCEVIAPRPIAPLSTASVTTLQPTLRWDNGGLWDGAHVELCRDRALSIDCMVFDAVGTNARPSAPLAAGVWFWRLTGRAGAVTGLAPGPTWELFVGRVDTPVDTSYGTTLDPNGDGYPDVMVGAPGIGTVDLYAGGPSGPSPDPRILHTPACCGFGSIVTSAGDVDGDGFGDVLIGLEYAHPTVYLYLGSASGLRSAPSASLTDAAVWRLSVAPVGDVNADGYADVILGGIGASPAPMQIYLGGPAGLSAAPLVGAAVPDIVTAAGDVNGDGAPDLIASHYGVASLYLGTPAGLASAPVAVLADPRVVLGNFGASAAGVGDLNADGFADVVIGADIGGAYLYLGGPRGLDVTPSTVLEGVGSEFAWAVAGAGDVNGDGHADLLVGSMGYGNRGPGAAYLYLGDDAGLVTTPITLTSASDNEGFGFSVSGAGDTNGDGYDDVVVGAWVSDAAFAFVGGAGGIGPTPAAVFHATTFSPYGPTSFGFAVSNTPSIPPG